MADAAQNEGFHVMDDFVCQAIYDPSLPLANPANQGRNEGIAVGAEITFDPSGSGTSACTTPRPEHADAKRKGRRHRLRQPLRRGRQRRAHNAIRRRSPSIPRHRRATTVAAARLLCCASGRSRMITVCTGT